MASIFMSFIHEEEQVASNVKSFIPLILGQTVNTFMSSDKNAIYAGEDWMTRIFEELRTTKVLVSMLSLVSVQRPWINFEAGAAWMRDAKVIPVCIGGLTINQLPKPYSSLQAVEINSLEGAYYLFSSIAHHLDMALPKKPIFSEDLPSSWSEADKVDNKTLFTNYQAFQLCLKLALMPKQS
jgi:hypothetical protein